MGSYYKKKHAGTFGDISAFSTHPLKNLNALGDGGFIITNNKRYYEKIKLYRNHGLKSRDNVEVVGVNSRLDSLQAEVLSFRLKRLKKIISRRNSNINLYKKLLNLKQIKIIETKKNFTDSHVMFITLCNKRDRLQKFLAQKSIQSLVYYKTPLHLHKALKFLKYKKGDFPVAERLTKNVLSFPHHQHLTQKEIIKVAENIKNFIKMKIPFNYLPQQFKKINPIITQWKQLVKSSEFTLGPYVEKFEKEFAKYVKSKYCISTNNGTDALILSLKALGVKKGDEVITVSNTFYATAGAIVACGAKPVLVDCDDRYQINLKQIEKKITKKLK